MLDYSFWQNAYGLSVEEREEGQKQYILSELLRRQQYLNAKNGEIRMKQYEANLITKDIITVIKEDMNMNYGINIFAGFNDNIFNKAWICFCENRFKELSEEDQKSYKETLGFVNLIITKSILGSDQDFVLEDVVMYNYGDEYWFKYKYKDVHVRVAIPVFSNANEKNYTEIIAGYSLYYENVTEKGIQELNHIITDLDYTKLLPAFRKWYEDNCTVKKGTKLEKGKQK